MIDWIKQNLNEESLGAVTELAIKYGTSIIGALILLIVTLIVSGWAKNAVVKGLRRVKFDDTLTKFFGSLTRWLVLLIGIVACLGIFGIDTTSVAGVLAGASLAIGLAFQGSLSNIAAGVMLLTFRPFTVGQVVSVAGQTGGVEEISLFTTTLNTPDGKHVIIPNGQIFGSTIVNLTHNALRRVDVNIGVDYDADIDETRKVLVEAAKKSTSRAEGQEIVAFLAEYADNSVNWQVRVMSTPANYWAVHQEVMRAIKYALDDAGIGIPFPQVVVHRADAE